MANCSEDTIDKEYENCDLSSNSTRGIEEELHTMSHISQSRIEVYPNVAYTPLPRKNKTTLHAGGQTRLNKYCLQNRQQSTADSVQHSQLYDDVLTTDELGNVGVKQTIECQRSKSPEYMEIASGKESSAIPTSLPSESMEIH